jgi:sugar phosphate isomerase/epimerase
MKIGFNLATIDWGNKFENLPILAKEAESNEIEFPIQLWLQHGCFPEILKSLKVCNVSGILHQTEIFPQSIFTTHRCFEEQINQLVSKLQAVKGLKCSAMSLGIDPWVTLKLETAEKLFLERVSYLASSLAVHDISLNLEYISHKIAQPDVGATAQVFCSSLTKALYLIEKLNVKSIKLLLDVIHWFADGMSIEPKALADRIGLVHLCDYPHQNTNSILDLNRVLPFEGKLPLDRFLSSLRAGGYKGSATIEVFRTESYQPSLSQLRMAISKCKKCDTL